MRMMMYDVEQKKQIFCQYYNVSIIHNAVIAHFFLKHFMIHQTILCIELFEPLSVYSIGCNVDKQYSQHIYIFAHVLPQLHRHSKGSDCQ